MLKDENNMLDKLDYKFRFSQYTKNRRFLMQARVPDFLKSLPCGDVCVCVVCNGDVSYTYI